MMTGKKDVVEQEMEKRHMRTRSGLFLPLRFKFKKKTPEFILLVCSGRLIHSAAAGLASRKYN